MANEPNCIARLDKLQLLAQTKRKSPPSIPGYRVERDHFVRSQTSIQTYRRSRTCTQENTGTKLFIQYRPACPWLPEIKVTVVPSDRPGLLRSELEVVVSEFPGYKLLCVELALDFSPALRIDGRFVRLYAAFGRSRLSVERPGFLRFGTRHSDKLVRCYFKPEVGAYRIEVELHGAWLRKKCIREPDDLALLPGLVFPSHVCFTGSGIRIRRLNEQTLCALREWSLGWR